MTTGRQRDRWRRTARWLAQLAAVAMWCGIPQSARAFTLEVVDSQGIPISSGFRWLVQEDTTRASIPGEPALPGSQLSVSFHTSYAPVVVKGSSAAGDGPVPVDLTTDRRYFVSVLPDEGYTIGGAPVAAGQETVTVTVSALPLPTAQISVFVFEDNHPINNAPDQPEEVGLEGFSIVLYEAGGRYGMSGGQVSQDAFGNPLGTSYNADGSVAQLGDGTLMTDETGTLLIQNLSPGKYTIEAVPPTGSDWHQTSTIEGTKGIDAWSKAGEPPFFVEFGPPGYHVYIGFVHTINDTSILTGGASITGRVVNLHNSRPPDFTFYAGEPVPGAWVGLNDLAAGNGPGIYAAPCDPDTGEFTIPNVPVGDYQLVFWDENLDIIFALLGVSVPEGAAEVDLQDIPVFNWFSRLEASVFYDGNENGFRDPGEAGISDQVINIRFRDGTVYQSLPTDTTGSVAFTEVFPFFNWLIAEVDFTRFKATGATVIVDAGGAVMPDQDWTYPSRDKLAPQPQCTSVDPDGTCVGPIVNPNTGNNLSRTEVGPVLLEAFQGFLGQTSVLEFGKRDYPAGENGGISGIVHYSTTRAENDPRYGSAEPWEPGIPRVQVTLYQDFDQDGVIDDLDGDGGATLADVDNPPFDWKPDPADPGKVLVKGPEDVDHDGDGAYDAGDALQIVTTDSWDDNLPTGCQGEVFYAHDLPTDCYDGLRNFNQVRPGVFDGGYLFDAYYPGGLFLGGPEEEGLEPGTYIVEAAPPPGYEIVKEEDKNVDFGDSYTPNTALLPPICVGDQHLLLPELSLFPGVENPSYDPTDPDKTTPLCDRKQVSLAEGQNAAANFFLFTEVPVAAHLVGFILDDLSNEFDPTAPTFGEKYAPPWLPISIRDWTGQEFARVYADEWGAYNALVPSTYSVNIASPSGVSPNMLTTCMNSPGPILDTRPGSPTYGQMIEDPYFNRQYSQFCYTFQYMPGTTTYLDTPVVPVAAFTGPEQFPLDCEQPDGTPVLYSVSGPSGGPYVSTANGTQQLTLTSMGQVEVPNPEYDGQGGTQPKTMWRDYGFGDSAGSVTIGGVSLQIAAWTSGTITATVPGGVSTGQLEVHRADGVSSVTGVTVTVGGSAPIQVAPGGSIQAAIDAASPGSLILVPPGTYEELVIMWKPVRLQGWGAGSTLINAVKAPAEKLQAWRDRVEELVSSGAIDLLPGQPTGGGFPEPSLFFTEEGPGIIVLAKDASPGQGGYGSNPNARIDGFTITGADQGGGIFVNGYARFLEIANNRVVGNQGFYGGGIRVGHPLLTTETAQGLVYVDGQNDDLWIHHNQILENGGLGGAGGGVSLCTGTDRYEVTDNYICGNFTIGDGGGIGHLGLSADGLIARNQILFNQSFDQGTGVNGGGVLIAGSVPVEAGTLSPGSGSVSIVGNLIQGNLAGAGDGGGIRLQFVNGQDVQGSPNTPSQWYAIEILNNIIANNVAGLAGGGMSLQDVILVRAINTTFVNNDSVATAGEAFVAGNPNTSNPQPAGVVSRAHSDGLYNAIGLGVPARPFRTTYANPVLINDIIWHNRSFYFQVDDTQDPPFYGLQPDVSAGEPPVYWDLEVLGTPTAEQLDPRYCLLTALGPYDPVTNVAEDPAFVAEYTNGARNLIKEQEFTTAIQAAPAFDEGGNFIDVRFGPLTLIDPATGLPFGDYHLTSESPAIDAGLNSVLGPYPELRTDYDGDPRPLDGDGNGPRVVDIGSDEF